MRETTRTFIAIPVPESVGERLARLQAELSPEVPGCRWTAHSPFHITLAFLGDVRNRDLNELCLAVAAAAEPFPQFALEVTGLGAFPSAKKPRVVWAGATAPDLAPLNELRAGVVQAATRAGYRPDDPRFHPHVTLGRFKTPCMQPGGLTETIQRRGWSAGWFPVTEVVTFASTLGPGGAAYAPLGRARLRGEKTDPSP
jgi:2'-5' RNA ligase